jgi:hypothetical protein
VDNIKINFREIIRDGMDWTNRVQDRDQWRALVDMANETSSFIKYWEIF